MSRKSKRNHQPTERPGYRFSGNYDQTDMEFHDASEHLPTPECLLCGGEGVIRAFFVPACAEVAQALGTPPGKRRALLYGLCWACWGDGDTSRISPIVESTILARMARRWARARGAARS